MNTSSPLLCKAQTAFVAAARCSAKVVVLVFYSPCAQAPSLPLRSFSYAHDQGFQGDDHVILRSHWSSTNKVILWGTHDLYHPLNRWTPLCAESKYPHQCRYVEKNK
eukprot:1177810-Prorocentrum_minimum.AAC.3